MRYLREAAGLLESLEIKAPLILSEEKPATVQLVVREDRGFEICGKQEAGDGDWTLHAQGRFGHSGGKASGAQDLGAIKARCRREKTRDDCYREFAARGLEYGAQFQALDTLRLGEEEACSEIKLSGAGSGARPLPHPSGHARCGLSDPGGDTDGQNLPAGESQGRRVFQKTGRKNFLPRAASGKNKKHHFRINRPL
jgi:hypothetical protein